MFEPIFWESWCKYLKTVYCFIIKLASMRLLAMLFSRCEQQKSLSFLLTWGIVEDKHLPFVSLLRTTAYDQRWDGNLNAYLLFGILYRSVLDVFFSSYNSAFKIDFIMACRFVLNKPHKYISFWYSTKFVYLFCDWFPAIYMTEFILNWNTQVLSSIIYTNFLSSPPGDGLLISEWVTTKCVRNFETVHVHTFFDRARWITPSISSERQNIIELILQH